MDVTPTLTYLFESDGDATRFTRAMFFEAAGMTREMESFLLENMTTNNAGYVQNLKDVLESGCGSPA